MIGTELIQKCEDLRDEYQNFLEIYNEVQESEMQVQDNLKKSSSLLSAGGNEKFLNQELNMFIDNLQRKALDSGLDENSLIPNKNQKDK